MNEFLDKFLQRHSKSDPQTLAAYSSAFSTAIDAIHASNGARAFRPERSVNAAVFDAVMVGLAKRLETKPKLDPAAIGKAYGGLLVSPDFVAVTSKATANEKTVASRIQLATAAFAGL
jgi:hypothetical protein